MIVKKMRINASDIMTECLDFDSGSNTHKLPGSNYTKFNLEGIKMRGNHGFRYSVNIFRTVNFNGK